MLELALVLLVGATIGCAVLGWKLRLERRRVADAADAARLVAEELGRVKRHAETLSRFEVVADAEATAAELLAAAQLEADRTLSRSRQDADRLAQEARRLTEDAEMNKADLLAAARRETDQALAQSRVNVEQLLQEVRLQAEESLSRARSEAEMTVSSARRNAADLLAAAKKEADAVASAAAEDRAAARERAEQATARAESLVTDATREAHRILEAAQKRAEQTAGDALAAVQNARHLEQTARAMRNVIEGYGDRYIIPTAGLLDELAEEFGFTEAGQTLKAARERTRSMIKSGSAALCDYVEPNRRATAVDFVLDAFNGKVDSVFSDVRHDNFGTLEQKLRDAYSLVNFNGQAFRNARIAPDYLDARIEELRWAVIVNELKAKDREEQRLLKERIREEERAQREYERAMKEAEKEEDTLRKAIERARKEVEKASDEQKSKYEAQLAELAAKLQVAEEKSQRALSMAQQTKAGHVYVISNVGSFGENVYKIGLTRRLEPLDRIRELGDASVPFEFDVHALIKSEDAPALEHELHKHFVHHQVNKVNARKEFFRVSLHDVRELVASIGCAASWTMAAECREFKETRAIELALESHSIEEADWADRQISQHDAVLKEALPKESAA